MSAIHATATNLSVLGQALDQTTISSPTGGTNGHHQSLAANVSDAMVSAAALVTSELMLTTPRKSPKKRERTDSMKRMVDPPVAQRARRDSGSGDVSGEDEYGDVSDASSSEGGIKLPVKDRTGSAVEGVPAQHLITKAVSSAPPAKEKSNPRRWSKAEDESLRLAVERSGERNWKAIAEQVPGRNHTQCLQRWTKVLKPGLIKGHWDPEEDAKLKELVSEGKRNWGQVASLIPGRTSKQCRERWCNHLDPNINKGTYTEEEDRLIMEMQARLGNRWSIIAQQLKGRTEDAVKIRWKSLMRGKKAAGKDGKPDQLLDLSTPTAEGSKVNETNPLIFDTTKLMDDKLVRPKPARTPTRLKTRAASPVAKVEPPLSDHNTSRPKTIVQTPIITQAAPTVALGVDASVGKPIDLKDVSMSLNPFGQSASDLASMNFQMNHQAYPSNSVSIGSSAAAAHMSSTVSTSVGGASTSHPSLANQTTISPANQPVYAMAQNPYAAMNQMHRPPYNIQAPHQMHPNMNMPPNYASSVGGPSHPGIPMHNQYAMSMQPTTAPMHTSYGGYAPGMVNVNHSSGRPMSLTPAPVYYTPSNSMAPPGMAYPPNTAAYPGSGQHRAMVPQHMQVQGLVPEPLEFIPSSTPAAQVQSLSAKLATPREEWGSSQTPRSHMIMTEGHASAYELFHQQRLRLMLKEREKGMTLTSAPSPGQAMLTKELKANKERQKRQEMMQKGWKSAIESLNNDSPSMEDNDGLMDKVNLSALDPTDDDLMESAVDISISTEVDDTSVDVDDPVMSEHE